MNSKQDSKQIRLEGGAGIIGELGTLVPPSSSSTQISTGHNDHRNGHAPSVGTQGATKSSLPAANAADQSQMLAADSERLFIGDILADDNSDYGAESDKASQQSGRLQEQQQEIKITSTLDQSSKREQEEHKETGDTILQKQGASGAQEIQSFIGMSDPRKGSRILSDKQLLEEDEESSEPEIDVKGVVAKTGVATTNFESTREQNTKLIFEPTNTAQIAMAQNSIQEGNITATTSNEPQIQVIQQGLTVPQQLPPSNNIDQLPQQPFEALPPTTQPDATSQMPPILPNRGTEDMTDMTLMLLLNTSAVSQASQASKKSQQSSSPESVTAAAPLASPLASKIYGSRHYYDYYTAMEPQSRMPSLPKPTYSEKQNHPEEFVKQQPIEQQQPPLNLNINEEIREQVTQESTHVETPLNVERTVVNEPEQQHKNIQKEEMASQSSQPSPQQQIQLLNTTIQMLQPQSALNLSTNSATIAPNPNATLSNQQTATQLIQQIQHQQQFGLPHYNNHIQYGNLNPQLSQFGIIGPQPNQVNMQQVLQLQQQLQLTQMNQLQQVSTPTGVRSTHQNANQVPHGYYMANQLGHLGLINHMHEQQQHIQQQQQQLQINANNLQQMSQPHQFLQQPTLNQQQFYQSQGQPLQHVPILPNMTVDATNYQQQMFVSQGQLQGQQLPPSQNFVPSPNQQDIIQQSQQLQEKPISASSVTEIAKPEEMQMSLRVPSMALQENQTHNYGQSVQRQSNLVQGNKVLAMEMVPQESQRVHVPTTDIRSNPATIQGNLPVATGIGIQKFTKKQLETSSNSKTSDSFSKEVTTASKNSKGISKGTQDLNNDILNTAQILQESPALDQADREQPEDNLKLKDVYAESTPANSVQGNTTNETKKYQGSKQGGKKQGSQETEISRSPFLTDLIQKINSKEEFDYRIIRTHVVECAVDQQGSRFIQQMLDQTRHEESQMKDSQLLLLGNNQEGQDDENHSDEEQKLRNQPFKDLIFHEALPCLHQLINDVFGNYVVQKLVEFGSDEQREAILDQILGHMLKLTKSKYGCRVIQKAFEFAEKDQRNLLVSELKNQNVMALIQDQNANHVIQRCLDTLEYEQTLFITQRVIQKLDTLCVHAYGCRVIQKVLLIASAKEQSMIIKFIIFNESNFQQYILDQFGNYLIQSIMDLDNNAVDTSDRDSIKQKKDCKNMNRRLLWEETIAKIYVSIRTKVVEYSCHKFASNVIEKCIRGKDWQMVRAVIQEIVTDDQEALVQMIADKFGNYVIQKCAEILINMQKEPQIDQIIAKQKQDLHNFFFSQIVNVFRLKPHLIAPNPTQGKRKQKQQNAQEGNYGRHVYDFLKKNMPHLELPLYKEQFDFEEHKMDNQGRRSFVENRQNEQFDNQIGQPMNHSTGRGQRQRQSPQQMPQQVPVPSYYHQQQQMHVPYENHAYPQKMNMTMPYQGNNMNQQRGRGGGGKGRGQGGGGQQRSRRGRGQGFKNRNSNPQGTFTSGGFGGNNQGYGPPPPDNNPFVQKNNHPMGQPDHPQNWQSGNQMGHMQPTLMRTKQDQR